MKTVKVKLFQSLLDISVQEHGTPEGLVIIALANDISITDELTTDLELNIPVIENTNAKTLKYYSDNNIIPATGQIESAIEDLIYDEFIDGNQSPPIIYHDPTFSDQYS